VDAATRLERLEFADGTVLSGAQVAALGSAWYGTEGNDTMTANGDTRLIEGYGGNDALTGGAAGIDLRGGAGNDTLWFASVANNTIDGGSGNDTLIADANSSQTAQSLLTGGTGDDTITGNAGATTYFYNRGDGRDTIADTGAATVVDRLIFGAGIGQGDMAFSRAQNDLVLTIGATDAASPADQIRVTGWFQQATRVIERLQFDDGTVLTAAQVSGMSFGGAGADTLGAAQDQHLLSGQGGNDSLAAGVHGALLAGGSGNDTLTGGAAGDLLYGGKGDDVVNAGARDVIAYNGGDGADTVTAAGQGATLSLGAGIDVAQLLLAQSGADLLLSLGGSDCITLKGWYAATQPAQGIGRLQLAAADGTHLYDFHAIVAAFDTAHGADSAMTTWVVEAQLSAAAQASPAGAALGGVLAVDIAAHGAVTLLSAVADVVRAPAFGLDPQLL